MSNETQLRIYDSSSGSPLADPDRLIERAQGIHFSTIYPGGIFKDASFFIPCDPTRYFPIADKQRIQIKNGPKTVWEGIITSIELAIEAQRKGLDVQASGYGGLAATRYKYNRWIDRRFQSNIYGVWTPEFTATGTGNKVDVDQNDQILIKPKQVDWGNGETFYITTFMNEASAVKRIVFDYDLNTLAEALPVRAKKFTGAGSSYSANLGNMIDGNAGSSQTITLTTADYLYIGFGDPAGVTGFRFDFGATVNANAATLSAEYWGVDGAWHALTLTDNTATAGATWAKDETVAFTEIDGWDQSSINGSQKFYYVRFSVSANLTANVVIVDIFVVRSQAWTLFLNDLRHSTTLWSVNVTGTGSQDITLSPTSDYLGFGITSNAAQKVTGSGLYAKLTNLALVAESWDGTAKTTAAGMLQDMVHYLGAPFKDDYTYLAANTYDMLSTGFVADDLQESILAQMRRLGNFNATDEPYSVGILETDVVSGNNTSPVVYYEKVPALTDYDYAVRLDEDNLSGLNLVLSADFDTLFTQAYVRFTLPNGKQDWANYNDYAGLRNVDSATKHYSRLLIVDGGTYATPALAGPAGAVQVNAKSKLATYMRGPLRLQGTIRRKDGRRVAVCEVRAGKRIKIENFRADLGDVSSSGLTFLVSQTEYDDATGVLTAYASVSDNLPMYLSKV